MTPSTPSPLTATEPPAAACPRPTPALRPRVALAWIALVALTCVGALSAEPQLSISPGHIDITGLEAHSDALLYGLSRQPIPWTERLVPHAEPVRVDAEGKATVTLPVVPKSVWAVVDLHTGAVAVARPPGVELDHTNAPTRLARGGAALPAKGALAVLVARKGNGAWLARTADGGPGDRSGATTRSIALDEATFSRIAAAEAAPGPARLAELSHGDILIATDPATLSVFTTELIADEEVTR